MFVHIYALYIYVNLQDEGALSNKQTKKQQHKNNNNRKTNPQLNKKNPKNKKAFPEALKLCKHTKPDSVGRWDK